MNYVVYFIVAKGKHNNAIHMKIGVSNNLEKRLETLQTGSPLNLKG